MAALLLLLCVLQCLSGIQGHSVVNERISRVEAVVDPKVHIISSMQGTKTYIHGDLVHTDDIVLQFSAFDTQISLQLTPNNDIFHPTAAFKILNDVGSDVEEQIRPHDYRIYKGQVLLDDIHARDSWARITIRHDIKHEYSYPLFEGAFSFGNDIYHVQTRENYDIRKQDGDPSLVTSPLVVYRDSDLHTINHNIAYSQIQAPYTPHLSPRSPHDSDITCAMEEMSFNRKMTGQMTRSFPTNQSAGTSDVSVIWNKKRNVLAERNYSGGTQGCPTARKIAFMGVAADCTYVQAYGSIRSAKIQIITDWNMASAVYESTFNVSLGLIFVQMASSECPQAPKTSMNWNQDCSNLYTINDRLSDFSYWRGQRGDDGAALWHLMTRCSTGVKVGIAWLSQLCETQASQQIEDNGSFDWVSGTGVSSITRDEWKVVAHEIGHGFGAIHDCTALACPCNGECSCCPLSDTICSAGETYIMNPTSNVSSNDFSPCSISDVCSAFPNIGYCLQSSDTVSKTRHAICGNGVLEAGEECDPGLSDNACCFAKTCRLKPGAICDDYSSQCCLNCSVAPAQTECRPAISECDTPEYCTGQSTHCPSDNFDADGTSCANGTMQCASGVCTSRDTQCMARGVRLNITEQCSFQQDSCQVSCEDPTDPRNCLVLSGVFLDGTVCGLAGFCRSGNCVGTGALNTLKAWASQNKQIAIPVFLFGGLFILALLGWLAWCVARRYRQRRLAHKDKDSRPSSITSYQSKDNMAVCAKKSDDGGSGGTLSKPPHEIDHPDSPSNGYPVDSLAYQGATSPSTDTRHGEEWELHTISEQDDSYPSPTRPSHHYNQSEGCSMPSFVPIVICDGSGGITAEPTQTPWRNNHQSTYPTSAKEDSSDSKNPFTQNTTSAPTGTHRRVKSNV